MLGVRSRLSGRRAAVCREDGARDLPLDRRAMFDATSVVGSSPVSCDGGCVTWVTTKHYAWVPGVIPDEAKMAAICEREWRCHELRAVADVMCDLR
jgi:hypothetical protein